MRCAHRASDKCQREKRKTINGEDLLWALGTLGFEDYVEPLKLFLQKHREVILTPVPLFAGTKLLPLPRCRTATALTPCAFFSFPSFTTATV